MTIWVHGSCEPNTQAPTVSITQSLARSMTSGGIDSYLKPTANSASWCAALVAWRTPISASFISPSSLKCYRRGTAWKAAGTYNAALVSPRHGALFIAGRKRRRRKGAAMNKIKQKLAAGQVVTLLRLRRGRNHGSTRRRRRDRPQDGFWTHESRVAYQCDHFA